MSQRIKDWIANIPVISYVLVKLCPAGGSVVEAQWRWKKCRGRDER